MATDVNYRNAVRLLAVWVKDRLAALPADLRPDDDAEGVKLALAYIVEDVTKELRRQR